MHYRRLLTANRRIWRKSWRKLGPTTTRGLTRAPGSWRPSTDTISPPRKTRGCRPPSSSHWVPGAITAVRSHDHAGLNPALTWTSHFIRFTSSKEKEKSVFATSAKSLFLVWTWPRLFSASCSFSTTNHGHAELWLAQRIKQSKHCSLCFDCVFHNNSVSFEALESHFRQAERQTHDSGLHSVSGHGQCVYRTHKKTESAASLHLWSESSHACNSPTIKCLK